MWDWLQSLSGGAAAFVGSASGAAIGLIALVIGALFNAWLNRRRDDRLREHEKRSVAVALLAELEGIERTLSQHITELREHSSAVLVPDLAQSVRVLSSMLPKIGLLDVRTIRVTIDAYIMIEQYSETLISMGGTLDTALPHRIRVVLPEHLSGAVADVNENTASYLQEAIDCLRAFGAEECKIVPVRRMRNAVSGM
jgi:hypothetical protein